MFHNTATDKELNLAKFEVDPMGGAKRSAENLDGQQTHHNRLVWQMT